ncbi:hypothetical protein GCM10010914_07640 [Deinococcus wulumuqiensis]|uniref:Uncharacterized protein n=1 Tax=Deinococcus wulumuqiensis TaxID=980427 RepID=A0AAV4K2G3_9DEIO|nr:hypothetical protein GCM10010914_07640 [Deinococcus wulumuqiensis]GGP28780.1 hypothetical protein GCM10008021_04310 [Deinococcus wulumuqiensis]
MNIAVEVTEKGDSQGEVILEHLTERRNVFLASGLGQLEESECKTLSRADLQSCAADWDSSAGENGVMRGAVPRITSFGELL